jgi:hypothetical protein
MITIVTYFGEQVVKFIFGGRNSGQRRKEEDRLPSRDANNGSQEPKKKDPNL